MNQTKVKNFHLSYYSYDQKAATAWPWIAAQIEQAGLSVSIRPWDDLPGDDFVSKMEKASQFCESIMVLVSGASVTEIIPNDDVKTQFIMGATGLEKNLIIIRLDDSELAKLFAKFNMIDLNCFDEKEAQTRLLNGISTKLPHQGITPPVFWANQNQYTPRYTDLGQAFDSATEVLAIRQKDLNSFLHDNLLQKNYHMQLELEIETQKEVEVKDKVTGKIEKKVVIVWEIIDLKTILSDSRHYLLINPSGMGKTIFSYFICGELLNHNNVCRYLPLLQTCLGLNSRKPGESICYFFNSAIESFYNNSRTHLVGGDWSNLCLVLDALDQARNIEEIISSLNSSSKETNYQRTKIILTSRENTAHLVPPEFQHIRLKLPEKQEIQNYLGDQYSKLEPLIRSNREMVTVPILLEMLRILTVSGRLKTHIHNRTSLYHEFIQLLINKEKEKPRFFSDSQEIQVFFNCEVEDYLERLAFMSLQNNEILEIQKENLAAYGIDSFKKDALLRLGILIELFEERTAKLIFRHQSFQAYLAARFIYHQDRDFFRQLISKVGSFYHDVWQEVIRFYLVKLQILMMYP